jgi:integrase
MLDVSKSQGLLRRGNVWWYRRRVPLDLVEAFGGKRELKESLRTESLSEAKARRNLVAAKFDRLFEMGREGQRTGAIDFNSLPAIQRYVDEQDAVRAREHQSSNWTPRDTAAAASETLGLIARYKHSGHEDTAIAVAVAAGEISGVEGAQPLDGDHFELLRRAVLELERRDLARLRHDYRNPTFDPLLGPTSRAGQEPASIKLDALIEAYEADYAKTGRGMGKKRQQKTAAAFQLIKEFFGSSTPVGKIDRQRCREFRDILGELPSNRTKYSALPSGDLNRVATEAAKLGLPKLSHDSQQAYLSTLKRLLAWAEREEHTARNPADKLTALGEKSISREARDPFSPSQLDKIFNAPLYRGCKNDGDGYHIPGKNVTRGTRFWVPLIGLFSGMRLNEICQLDARDARQSENGVWYFAIDGGTPDKNVKNQFSKREVPIHLELIKMGFLTFVRSQQKRGGKLFPDLKRSERGYHSERISRWFNEGLLQTAKAKTDTTSFHSFRHCFRDALRVIHAPPDVVQGIGGWRMEKGESARYGTGLLAQSLQLWMNRIAYPKLDLAHLYVE